MCHNETNVNQKGVMSMVVYDWYCYKIIYIICPSIFPYSKCIIFINDPKNIALYNKMKYKYVFNILNEM
jgi:hypothetical protein